MKSWDFREYLKKQKFSYNSIEFILKKVRAIEGMFNVDVDDIVMNDTDMLKMLNDLSSRGHKWATTKINALRHYYKFINSKEFPIREQNK